MKEEKKVEEHTSAQGEERGCGEREKERRHAGERR